MSQQSGLSHNDGIHTIRPFSCGIEFAIWEDHNCARCAHSGQDSDEDGGEYHWGSCEMEDALTVACVGIGLVPKPLARQFGWHEVDGRLVTPRRCGNWVDDRRQR